MRVFDFESAPRDRLCLMWEIWRT